MTVLSASSGIVNDAPRHRSVEIGALGSCEREMLRLGAAADTLRGGLGCGGEPCRVSGTCDLGHPGLAHRFEREGADAVEQPVANGHRRAVVVDDHQRAVGETTDDVDRGRRGHVEGFEDRLDRRERCAAGERRKRPEATLVVGEEKLIAPADRRLECSTTLGSPAGRIAQHEEPIVETAGDLLDRQRLRSRRREFDREGEAVE